MKKRSLLVAMVGVGLVAVTITPPQSTRFFSQSAPPNAQPIRLLARSHLSLVADLFWIRAIGVTINLKVPADGRALVLWCGLVTELDPQFVWPYIFAALLGPMTSSAGNHNVAEANALLKRGMENIPGDYRLPLYLSFNQLHLDHDVRAAAETLRRGARAPGAPLFMGQLATRLLAQSNDFDAASAFAEELEQSSTDPEVRAIFGRRRLEIERDRLLATLQRAVDSFRAARGQPPETLMQLLLEGFITELPKDPLGGEFQLGPDGAVSASSGARLKAHSQEAEVR